MKGTQKRRTTRKYNRGCSCNKCTVKAVGGGLRPLRIALCLIGQPRRFQEGHTTFMNWLKAPYHQNVSFDTFFHAWKIPDQGATYSISPYREVTDADRHIDPSTLEKLIELYSPVAYAEDTPITFDPAIYENSLLYERTNDFGRKNVNNTLSQQYSRQKVRDLFLEYSRKHSVKYDFVICSRFDFLNPITLDFNVLDPSFVHLTNCRYPRRHLPDPLYICNPQTFSKLNNVFRNFATISNSEELANHFVKTCNELYIFHPEEILHMNYIWYFNDNSAFRYHDEIPNFHY